MFVISVFRECLVTRVDNRSMKILYLGTQTIQYTFYQIYDIIDLSNRKQNKKLEKNLFEFLEYCMSQDILKLLLISDIIQISL